MHIEQEKASSGLQKDATLERNNRNRVVEKKAE